MTQKRPDDATHVWTPAVETPFPMPWVFRRAYYKKVKQKWYSFSKWGDWVISGNDPSWFKEETQAGYFVTVKKFTSPGFVPVTERM